MEFFLWFWLLDRRFFCDMRPLLKHFAFLWLIPILFHLCMAAFYAYCLYPFNTPLDFVEYVIAFVAIVKIISIICLFIMMLNLYKLSKNQPQKYKNIFVLTFERIKNSDGNKDNFIYYEDYWMARKNLLSFNGIIILVLSILHIIWSFIYMYNKNSFKNIFKLGEKFVISYEFLNIFFCLPVIILLGVGLIIKATFLISAMCCMNCVLSLSEICCKRNKRLNKTIDFSDIQVLEPEFV